MFKMILERNYFKFIILVIFVLSQAGASRRCGTTSDCSSSTPGTVERQAVEALPCLETSCSCDEGFFFDPDTKSCLQKQRLSRRRRNATEDPGKTVGGGCLSAAECLDGLRCTSGECQCPEDCSYDAGLQACYCGADEFSSLPLIIVAVVWAPINIFIWYKCFKSAREGRENTRRTEDGEESPSKLALHSNPPPPPIVVDSNHTVTNTRAASSQSPAEAGMAHAATPPDSADAPMQRPVFVVSANETEIPIDPRQPGIFTPPGPSRTHAPSAAWKETPRVN